MKITVNVLSQNKGRPVLRQRKNIWRKKMMIDYVKERGEERSDINYLHLITTTFSIFALEKFAPVFIIEHGN